MARIEARTREGLACGALQPIETEQVKLEDGGVGFLVRLVSSLRRKAAASVSAASDKGPPRNPFLPPDPALTLGPIGPAHLGVLNKFNVLERHLLIVTRDFEHQETLLTASDFRALCLCLAEMPGLGFYNGGGAAGASQSHKHLQIVPLPFDSEGPSIPLGPILTGSGPRCPALPFAHAFGRLGVAPRADPLPAAAEAHALYRSLLGKVGIGVVPSDGQDCQAAPYNLLLADDWMLLVPRTQECWQGISINALGFAGSLFVKERAQLELIRTAGPMRVLQSVAGLSPNHPSPPVERSY